MKFLSEMFQLLFIMAVFVVVAFVLMQGAMSVLNAAMGM